MRETVLRARGVRRIVLRGIDLDIYKNDFTVVMGASGAGKSTLLHALSRTDEIDGGEILLGGTDIARLCERQMARIRAEQFGFVFQQANLIENLTLYENVLVAGFLCKTRSEAETRAQADALFARMNLAGAKDRLPREASGGEAQRCAIARAVINRPTILFADEPTGALNRKNSLEVLDLLSALNADGADAQTILMVTHDIRSAIRGNRILYLEDGAIVAELSLPRYDGTETKIREERLSAWLEDLQW